MATRWLSTVVVAASVAAGSGARVVSDAAFDQSKPAIAFDGTNFLAVWQDTRDIGTDTSSNVYACRLAPSLEVLDSAGILVAGTREEDYVPAVCWGGSDYLVVWQRGC